MKLREMTRCGVLAAVLAVCAWLSIPLGDQAVSLQSFAVFLALGLLGGRGGTLTVLVYLLLGAAGVPVFAGFRGGVAVLLGPTGGYLWGFLAAGLLYWALERAVKPWLNGALSMALVYICGTLWYALMYAPGPIWPILMICVVPYLIPDAIKITLALTLSRRLKRLVQ